MQVKPLGELDLATVPELDQQVQELVAVCFEDLLLDLRGLSFIDATGLTLLLELAQQSQREGWRLTLIPGKGQVERILVLTGCRDRLPCRHVVGGLRPSG